MELGEQITMSIRWIKIRPELRNDPSVRKMSRLLSQSCHATLGQLVHFWGIADLHADENGYLDGWTFEDINSEIGVEGFAQALPSEWLVETSEGVELPNYSEHNGSTAKKRASEQKKKARQRKRKDVPSDVPVDVPPCVPSVMGTASSSSSISNSNTNNSTNTDTKTVTNTKSESRLPEWVLPMVGLPELSHVRLNEKQAKSLTRHLHDNQEFAYWLQCLDDYLAQGNRYKDHARAILAWRRRRLEEGKVWNGSGWVKRSEQQEHPVDVAMREAMSAVFGEAN